MNEPKSDFSISTEDAIHVLNTVYEMDGSATALPGELDANFRIETRNGQTYILKISRPGSEASLLAFQDALFSHLAKYSDIRVPQFIATRAGESYSEIKLTTGQFCRVCLLNWLDGRLWSKVHPVRTPLLESLGREAGKVTAALQDFDHPHAHRVLEWDLDQASWVRDHLSLFEGSEKELLHFFYKKYEAHVPRIGQLRKGVVHNDVNDNNILVTPDLEAPRVAALIDYGDAVWTSQVNDLAIALAYAVMEQPDPLSAALAVVQGYHQQFPLEEMELEALYTLVAMRLVVSVVKAKINQEKEPENTYHQISTRAAWDVLEKWQLVNEQFAHFAFRTACGLDAHPDYAAFVSWAAGQEASLSTLFPSEKASTPAAIDMSVSSLLVGNVAEFADFDFVDYKINKLRFSEGRKLLVGGYQEPRAFYSTAAYQKEGNAGPEYRTIHLGIDVWLPAHTPLHAPFAGEVFSAFDNAGDKDYGPTILLKHNIGPGKYFFTLYGHLSRASLDVVKTGQRVEAGQLIGYLGAPEENGNWPPHLHFQIMLDMLGNDHDFPGVGFPAHREIWKSICPDPDLLFSFIQKTNTPGPGSDAVLEVRKAHLGPSLSLSYADPLHIVRGQGVYLLDASGRRYLDTVNNVAHVGHEHPWVVKAGQEQMAVLNTNTRYLHQNLTAFAEELLATFPDELEVAYFVNSGSEANELALRMAKTLTGAQDFIALEHGYHGNTNACIDVSSYKFDGKGGKGAPEHTHIVPIPDVFRGRHQGPDSADAYAAYVDQAVQEISAKGRSAAGFIAETIVSCGGQIELPQGYLSRVYERVRAAGGLCIADEVQHGCGRVGNAFWAFQVQDVVPDIVTIGKPLGNGHPVAAVVCTRRVAEAFSNGMEYFNTFGGNPVSCAIGRAVLRVVREAGLQQHALEVGMYLKKNLNELATQFPILADVRGSGLFLGVELADEYKIPQTAKARYLVNRMKELGILMSLDGPDNNVLKIKPPLIFSRDNADELLGRLEQVLKEDFMK
jgi:4-aminobutyrate aminotransferase-like enzyme/Ser/Thr protein kinase RdoA (MazF antagonist)